MVMSFGDHFLLRRHCRMADLLGSPTLMALPLRLRAAMRTCASAFCTLSIHLGSSSLWIPPLPGASTLTVAPSVSIRIAVLSMVMPLLVVVHEALLRARPA